jgi:hypothetical protein
MGNPLWDGFSIGPSVLRGWLPCVCLLIFTANVRDCDSALAQSAGAAASEVISFDRQIVPILTRLGCNSGACHGSADGRGNFRLSLFGSDPDADHQAVTLDYQGRRVNGVRPAASLLVRKPWGELEHGGGLILERQGPESETLLRWLAAGAPRGAPAVVESLQIVVDEANFAELPGKTAVRVVARLAGETKPQDVTEQTLFTAVDPAALRVDDDLNLQVLRRGQHLLLARYLNQVAALQVTAPFSTTTIDVPWMEAAHFVDQQVFRTWQKMGLPPSPPADDPAWLRRVHLDLIGQLPSSERVLAFLADQNPHKRAVWVDELLASPQFIDYWTWKFAAWLELRSLPNEQLAFESYRDWLRQQLLVDAGWDAVMRQLLTTDGDSHQEGAANFSRLVADARRQAEHVGQVFAGIRLGCANCHDHPLDRWTQDDYHGFAAIFAKINRGRHVGLGDRGEVTHPRTQQSAVPRIPGQHDLAAQGDQRAAVVAWLLDRQHDYLARVMVNRLWQAMFGRGLVEPVDDMRPTNPATHPELLEQLAADFADHGYRIRHTLRVLALSESYARGSLVLTTNQADDRFYSRAFPRPLEPAVLADAIAQVTGVPETFAPHGTNRAIRVIDGALPAPTLDPLGRSCSAPACRQSSGGPSSLAAQLHLLNGDVINRKLRDPAGFLAQCLARGESIESMVQQFYLRALCRLPTAEESLHWKDHLTSDDPQQQREQVEDFVWSLLCSHAFTHR